LIYNKLGFINNDFALYGVTIFQRGDAIAIGCLISLNYKVILSYISKTRKYLQYPVIISFLVILVYKSLFSIFHIRLGFLYKTIGIGAISTFANVCIGVILICSIEFKTTLWFKFLNLRFMNYIGKLSYSIYLWQQLFTSYQPNYFFQKLPYGIFLIAVMSFLSFKFIETPFLHLRNKFKPSVKL
jgi:peptidoglycan/LPS O-acetylase OafA/YrhL